MTTHFARTEPLCAHQGRLDLRPLQGDEVCQWHSSSDLVASLLPDLAACAGLPQITGEALDVEPP
jgi:hypothetical protein